MERWERFVGGPDDFAPVGTVPPSTTRHLLEDLDVVDASREEQSAAISAWLETNTPSPLLLLHLQDSGFVPAESSTG